MNCNFYIKLFHVLVTALFAGSRRFMCPDRGESGGLCWVIAEVWTDCFWTCLLTGNLRRSSAVCRHRLSNGRETRHPG